MLILLSVCIIVINVIMFYRIRLHDNNRFVLIISNQIQGNSPAYHRERLQWKSKNKKRGVAYGYKTKTYRIGVPGPLVGELVVVEETLYLAVALIKWSCSTIDSMQDQIYILIGCDHIRGCEYYSTRIGGNSEQTIRMESALPDIDYYTYQFDCYVLKDLICAVRQTTQILIIEDALRILCRSNLSDRHEENRSRSPPVEAWKLREYENKKNIMFWYRTS